MVEEFEKDGKLVRMWRCESCKKLFSKKYNMQIHMRQHTGEKPYVCRPCGLSFKWRSSLRNHERYHADLNGFQTPAQTSSVVPETKSQLNCMSLTDMTASAESLQLWISEMIENDLPECTDKEAAEVSLDPQANNVFAFGDYMPSTHERYQHDLASIAPFPQWNDREETGADDRERQIIPPNLSMHDPTSWLF